MDQAVPAPAAAIQPAAGRSGRTRASHAPAKSRDQGCPRSPAYRSGPTAADGSDPIESPAGGRRHGHSASGCRGRLEPTDQLPRSTRARASPICSQPGSNGSTFNKARQRKIPMTASGGQRAGHRASNRIAARACNRRAASRRNGGAGSVMRAGAPAPTAPRSVDGRGSQTSVCHPPKPRLPERVRCRLSS